MGETQLWGRVENLQGKEGPVPAVLVELARIFFLICFEKEPRGSYSCFERKHRLCFYVLSGKGGGSHSASLPTACKLFVLESFY
ncbi:hypothetical protein AV530_006299 [Patagioenas fasciata monilis]|uniref:Uncharacterized protein n=1 Tax=Patagioenas fasciata monilis TaxID=372326 RepID=A0A1V4KG38_PATFA|nr:hypothetical protein AV530_006299 [Patagioenas fasciata monilis]